MDQLKAMQIFKCVAQCKSFTQAAEQLDLPKPTVTNAVQSVEQQLGVRLLQRTTRKVSLTVEGGIYLERCIRLLNDLEDVNALFLGPDHLPSGAVRVDLPERFARLQVIPALPDFFRQYPNIQVRLGSNDRYADLVGEGIDCALRVGTLRDSSLVAKRVGELHQVNVAAPSYLEQHGRPHSPADLARHYAVNFFSSQSGRDFDWEYQEDGATRSMVMRSLISVSSAEAYVASCRAGLGLIQAPRMGMEALLDAGELEEVMPRWRAAPLPVAIVYSHNKHLSPRVRVFVDWLAGILELA
ncbi:LysR family transcriptional regulator, regulator for bpeEF and oprC [Janthinobacterium sp. CG_23.3]|uniref:LysR family transcriptional regulator n=1 Tax=unclassified Janthinobacterium TaxID=2610881 RepID=UPI0003481B11|nr:MULTISPECIES: LysR family transcriptional regulator [unclassified Janthinobacterium]MEC5163441.1 LysR family transcriptional regulator for bpeEF and oprC [Janthinobacterium sp. CG_S6]